MFVETALNGTVRTPSLDSAASNPTQNVVLAECGDVPKTIKGGARILLLDFRARVGV
jgi:hypothetical protein